MKQYLFDKGCNKKQVDCFSFTDSNKSINCQTMISKREGFEKQLLVFVKNDRLDQTSINYLFFESTIFFR